MYICEEDYKKLMEIASSYDKVKEARKKYRETHKEAVNQRIKNWRLQNPEKFAAIRQRYQEKKKGVKND